MPELGGHRAVEKMQFTIRNKDLAKIEDRARFLEHLIEEYSRLLQDWTEKTNRIFLKEAEEYAEEDFEVYSSMYSSMQSAFDENEYREDLFYKSMILMAFSYYESTIGYLAKKANTNELIDAICKSHNYELSKEAKKAKDEINSNIRIVRNQLVHNSMGNPKHVDDLLRICREWSGIHFKDDEITISGSEFVIDSLKKELFILREICNKLGLKHKRIQT